MSAVPAYKTVYNTIKKEIKERVFPVGSLLPTECELEERFAVSRTTVRRAIGILVSEGYIKVTQGRGTEVLDPSTVQNLNHISSITESLILKGYRVKSREADIRKVRAESDVAHALGIEKGETVYQIQRLQCADDKPIAIMTNYLKVGLTPELEKYVGTFTGLYAFLERQYGIVMKKATEYLSAVTASFLEAKLLNIDVGAPLLCSRRISENENGIFEYSINKIVAENYEYCIHLSGRK